MLRLLQELSEWFRLLYLQIAAVAGGDCWAAGQLGFGLLESQVPVLSGCWAAGLSGCWALAGLPGCWAAGLAAGCCCASGLLDCCAAGLLLAAGLWGCCQLVGSEGCAKHAQDCVAVGLGGLCRAHISTLGCCAFLDLLGDSVLRL